MLVLARQSISYQARQFISFASKFQHQSHRSFQNFCTVLHEDLKDNIREFYQERETDGVQELMAKYYSINELSPDAIFGACYEASLYPNDKVNTKDLTSILNSMLASCVDFEDEEKNLPEKAIRLIEMMKEAAIEPNLISLSLAFSACYLSKVEKHNKDIAFVILDMADHLAKKQGGSKRRKAINLSKRLKIHTSDSSNTSMIRRVQETHPDFDVLFDDDNFIGINKPSSMVCYHQHKTTKGKHEDISLEDYLLQSGINLSTINPESRGFVHRLDRGTSGCILLAKNNVAHALLLTIFFKRSVKKNYLALIPASMSTKTKHSDDIREIEMLSVGQSGVINSIVDGRPANSSYIVKQSHFSVNTNNNENNDVPVAFTVRVNTHTGRKHQVRVHCSVGLNRPIFLENIYTHDVKTPTRSKKKKKLKKTEQPNNDVSVPSSISEIAEEFPPGHRFFLHAETLEVPTLNISLAAKLPQWWVEAVDKL